MAKNLMAIESFIPAPEDAKYIYLKGTGFDRLQDAEIMINGIGILESFNSRGLHVVTINRDTLNKIDEKTFDTYGNKYELGLSDYNSVLPIINYLNSLDDSVFILIVSYDAVFWSVGDIFENYGGDYVNIKNGKERTPFAFIGIKGMKAGSCLQSITDVGSSAPFAEISTYVADRMFVTSQTGETGLTILLDDGQIIINADENGIPKLITGPTVINASFGPVVLGSSNYDSNLTQLYFESEPGTIKTFAELDSGDGTARLKSTKANIEISLYDDGLPTFIEDIVDKTKICSNDTLIVKTVINYHGNAYTHTFKIPVIVLKKGDKGQKGESKAVIRQHKNYDSTYNYLCGAEGENFYDMVLCNGIWYLCIASCTGIDPTTNSAYWLESENHEFIATDFLISENAIINFGQMNQLLIIDDYGNPEAGIKGANAGGVNDGINIFAGDYVPADAPFRVNNKGEMWSTNAHIDGEINSIKGNIGGFSINSNYLLSSNSDGNILMKLGQELIKFTNLSNNSYIELGTCDLSGISSFSNSFINISNRKQSNNNSDVINVGIAIEVNSGTISDLTPYYGNHALLISDGDICGFRKRTRRINANCTLDKLDSNIITVTTSDIYITLPTDVEDGQEYFIMPSYNATYYGICIIANNNAQHWYYSYNNGVYMEAVKCVYDKVNNQWHLFN